jgi:hypothetical protein
MTGAGGGYPGGTFVATGNITPSSFVTLDAGVTGHVTCGTTGDFPIGISQQGTRNPSYPGLQDGWAATSGENIGVYMSGEECLLQVDAAYNPGTLLKPNANGIGTQTTADGDKYGAIQLDQSTVANQLIKVRVLIGERGV